MKKVTVNIANCTSGGGLQISVWFVRKLLEAPPHPSISFSFIVNRSQIESLQPHINSADVLVVEHSPMRSRQTRATISAYLAETSPDILFSTFGPSGIKADNQVSGFANAFVTSLDERLIFSIHGIKGIFYYIKYLYLGLLMRRSKYIFFETDAVRRKFCRYFRYPSASTTVVPNSISDPFLSDAAPKIPDGPLSIHDEVKIFIVTSTHRHKNVHLIPSYIDALRAAGFENFQFLLTLREAQYIEAAGPMEAAAREHLRFLGHLSPDQLLDAYRSCDIVVQPSELETYSAVYNEVRFTAKPLIASDRWFAREICGSFATFFEPTDPEDFAAKVRETLARLPEASTASWEARRDVLLPEEKFRRMVEIIENEAGAPSQARSGTSA